MMNYFKERSEGHLYENLEFVYIGGLLTEIRIWADDVNNATMTTKDGETVIAKGKIVQRKGFDVANHTRVDIFESSEYTIQLAQNPVQKMKA